MIPSLTLIALWPLMTNAASAPVTIPEPPPATNATRVATAVAAPAQHPDASAESPVEDFPVVVWTPRDGNPHELANALNGLFASGLVSSDVESRRVYASAVDRVVVVTGPQPHLDRAIRLLEELDDKSAPSRDEEMRRDAYVVREIPVRHMTMSDARVALRPLERQIEQRTATGEWARAMNLSYLDTQRVIVLHDTQKRASEVADLIARLDVPRPQVLLRAYLISGVMGGEQDPRVPTEAAAGLRELVPYDTFQLVSFGMVRSDAMSEMGISDTANGAEYHMVFQPESFDADAGRLSLANCQFTITRVEGTSRTIRKFASSAGLGVDEYTVLGGVGADADFLVLHLSLVGGE